MGTMSDRSSKWNWVIKMGSWQFLVVLAKKLVKLLPMASWVSALLCGKAEALGESVGKQVRGLEYAGAFVWSPIVQERKASQLGAIYY